MWKKFLQKKGIDSNVGAQGESDAVRYLKRHGYVIIDRNVRNKRGYTVGEIDIIAQKNQKLFFVEVKARTLSSKSLPPEMSITRQKLFKLERAIDRFRKENDKYMNFPYQLDALIITYAENKELLRIRYLDNIYL